MTGAKCWLMISIIAPTACEGYRFVSQPQPSFPNYIFRFHNDHRFTFVLVRSNNSVPRQTTANFPFRSDIFRASFSLLTVYLSFSGFILWILWTCLANLECGSQAARRNSRALDMTQSARIRWAISKLVAGLLIWLCLSGQGSTEGTESTTKTSWFRWSHLRAARH